MALLAISTHTEGQKAGMDEHVEVNDRPTSLPGRPIVSDNYREIIAIEDTTIIFRESCSALLISAITFSEGAMSFDQTCF